MFDIAIARLMPAMVDHLEPTDVVALAGACRALRRALQPYCRQVQKQALAAAGLTRDTEKGLSPCATFAVDHLSMLPPGPHLAVWSEGWRRDLSAQLRPRGDWQVTPIQRQDLPAATSALARPIALVDAVCEGPWPVGQRARLLWLYEAENDSFRRPREAVADPYRAYVAACCPPRAEAGISPCQKDACWAVGVWDVSLASGTRTPVPGGGGWLPCQPCVARFYLDVRPAAMRLWVGERHMVVMVERSDNGGLLRFRLRA